MIKLVDLDDLGGEGATDSGREGGCALIQARTPVQYFPL